MPRPIWKGHISFGLVNVPVVLYSAERRTDLQLHMVDSRDHSRIRYERVNSDTGDEVPWNMIVRGYEHSDGNYVILGEEELKRAAPEATRTIEIERFVDPKEIDTVYFDKPYYLEPGKGAEKGYVLLRRVLEDSGLVGITKVVIRTRQYNAMLAPMGKALLLNLLRYHQEIRGIDDIDVPTSVPKKQSISPQEMKIATMLVESMKGKWQPEEYHDEYRDALMKWIDKRVKSGDVEVATNMPDDDEGDAPAPINFMELLQKSLQKPEAKKTSKKATTRKAPARRKVG